MTTDRHWLGDLSLAVLLVLPTALAWAEAPVSPYTTAASGPHAAAPAVGPVPGRVGLLG